MNACSKIIQKLKSMKERSDFWIKKFQRKKIKTFFQSMRLKRVLKYKNRINFETSNR